MIAQAERRRDVCAYFNNDIHADAIADARNLKRPVEEAGY